MDTYEVRIEPLQPKIRHRVLGGFIVLLMFAGCFFLVRFSLSILFPTAAVRHRGLDRFASEMAVSSIVWAFGMLVIFSRTWNKPSRNKRRDFNIVIGADSIAAVYPESRRTVHKGKIRSIFDVRASSLRPGGIGISEKTEFMARMLGFVFVPNTLPEFDKLKRLAESWRESQ
jgi:hypothetical protein